MKKSHLRQIIREEIRLIIEASTEIRSREDWNRAKKEHDKLFDRFNKLLNATRRTKDFNALGKIAIKMKDAHDAWIESGKQLEKADKELRQRGE